jgi:hypothetical protein
MGPGRSTGYRRLLSSFGKLPRFGGNCNRKVEEVEEGFTRITQTLSLLSPFFSSFFDFFDFFDFAVNLFYKICCFRGISTLKKQTPLPWPVCLPVPLDASGGPDWFG